MSCFTGPCCCSVRHWQNEFERINWRSNKRVTLVKVPGKDLRKKIPTRLTSCVKEESGTTDLIRGITDTFLELFIKDEF